jgi:hypothetical protein
LFVNLITLSNVFRVVSLVTRIRDMTQIGNVMEPVPCYTNSRKRPNGPTAVAGY